MLLLHLLKSPYLGKGLIGLLLISLVACGSNDTSTITFPENGPEPLVDVLPETLALSAQAGEKVSEQLELKNERAQSIEFSTSSTRDWLSVSPSEGTLASGASVILTLSAECPDEPASFNSVFSLDTGREYPKELAVTLECEGGSATEDTDGDGATGTDDGTTDSSDTTDGSDGGEDATTDGSDETTGSDDADGTTGADTEDGADGEDATTDGEDAGSEDTGSEDTGSEDTGSEDADGSGDTGADGEEATDGADEGGAEDTGTEDTGTGDTGTEDTGTEDTGSEDTGTEDTGTEDTGADDGDGDTDGEDTGSDTGDTGEPAPQAELADLSPTELNLSAVAGKSVPATLSFSNAGDAPLEYALVQTSKETWLSFPGSAGSLEPGESASLNLTATCPAQAQTLSSFLDLETNDPNSPMTPIAVELICAAPPAQDVTLSISAEGSSFGRVVSEPAGINCLGSEGTCSADFVSGTSISLTAQVEQADAQFMGWLSGPCAGEFGATCELVLEDDLNVAVNFAETSSSAYNISLHFVDSSFSASQRAAFERAAQRWMQVTDH